MGARSYIVEGLGNETGYNSAPHGAGRRMSRTAARRQFQLGELEQRMASQQIEARVRASILDEHPLAYKDIDRVMEHARTLVRPVEVLSQIVNVKGD